MESGLKGAAPGAVPLGPAVPRSAGPRFAQIDVARGLAIIGMVVFHFCFDIGPGMTNLARLDAETFLPLVVLARLTAGSFLFLVGVSMVLATRRGFRPRPFLRRLAFIVGGAALVTLATWYVVPDEFVRFGILHAIALFSVLAIPFLFLPVPAILAVAAVAFLLPLVAKSDIFNTPMWYWLGLATEVPASVDHVPLLPWFGATLSGMAAARIALALGAERRWSSWRPRGRLPRLLAAMGRWSLPIYLVHQPILLGLLAVVALVVPQVGQDAASRTAELARQCEASCSATGGPLPVCRASCACVVDGIRAAGFLTEALADRLTPIQTAQSRAIAKQCIPEPPAEPLPLLPPAAAAPPALPGPNEPVVPGLSP